MSITIIEGQPTPEFMDAMNKSTNDWFAAAARQECGWICPDCCMSDHTGMPLRCMTSEKGAVGCNELLERDIRAWAPHRLEAADAKAPSAAD